MHTRHLTTPSHALYRIFVLPTLSTTASPATSPPVLTLPQRPLQHTTAPRRSFTTSPPRLAKVRAAEARTEKWDEEISSRLIYLINPETNTVTDPETGRMPAPVTRNDTLKSIDRDTHRIVQVSEGLNVEEDEQQSTGQSYSPFGASPSEKRNIPICKIVSKKDAFQQARKRKEDAKAKKRITSITNSIKTVELNWAIDGNDLSHRMNKMEGFLAEGRKVEVIFAAKKKGRKASEEECEKLLETVRGVVGGVEGAKEATAMSGKIGGFAVLSFQGPAPKVEKESVEEDE